MRYNPLAYIRSEKDILKLVNALIMNTKGEGEKSSEDFWVKAERLYYSALIGYCKLYIFQYRNPTEGLTDVLHLQQTHNSRLPARVTGLFDTLL